MNRVRPFAVSAIGADRRSVLFDPAGWPGAQGHNKSLLETRRWRHAWDIAWRRPARNTDELLTRAKMLLADEIIMDDSAEVLRLVRDVIAVLGRGKRP